MDIRIENRTKISTENGNGAEIERGTGDGTESATDRFLKIKKLITYPRERGRGRNQTEGSGQSERPARRVVMLPVLSDEKMFFPDASSGRKIYDGRRQSYVRYTDAARNQNNYDAYWYYSGAGWGSEEYAFALNPGGAGDSSSLGMSGIACRFRAIRSGGGVLGYKGRNHWGVPVPFRFSEERRSCFSLKLIPAPPWCSSGRSDPHSTEFLANVPSQMVHPSVAPFSTGLIGSKREGAPSESRCSPPPVDTRNSTGSPTKSTRVSLCVPALRPARTTFSPDDKRSIPASLLRPWISSNHETDQSCRDTCRRRVENEAGKARGDPYVHTVQGADQSFLVFQEKFPKCRKRTPKARRLVARR
ncbi:hypothetical protein EVAR_49384_1 [Eumeta japonica]|uniref:Uncharacterized protein n=1 Tax=Eumeta variegata TaxID=151549 RepID=A0A4C1YLW7_EUMVA|nr:hypothetical protein EVAR_49384_1 [Eumeta japonica]